MNSETRICQNCKNPFAIEPEDFDFYRKIDVPPPTFCPECRLWRRMTWRNERALHKRKCDAPGHTEELISMYSPESSVKVYDIKYWWSDQWNALDYGREYDFSKLFFLQFAELFSEVPHISLANINSIDSEYCNWISDSKNCYLNFGCGWNENVNYANKTIHCKDSHDTLLVRSSELCYECINCIDSYNLVFSMNCKECSDSSFLYDCKNCSHCFGCSNLKNASYCFFNRQYSKGDYDAKLKEFMLATRADIEDMERRFHEEIYLRAIHRFANIINSTNCTGNNIINSKNSRECFDNFGEFEDSKYVYIGFGAKNCYDCMGPGKVEYGYENVDTDIGSHNIGTITTYNSTNAVYSFNCHSCHDIFGCIGLKKKEYCILNKQYDKKSYEHLVAEIKKHMQTTPYVANDKSYGFGEFFPSELSPFCHNETVAQEYFPLTKEEAVRQGCKWKDDQEKKHVVTKKPQEMRTRSTADVSLLNEVIGCEHEGGCVHQCTYAFRIISEELAFYQKMKLPPPVLCPNCRHYERLSKQTPLKLWHRSCMCDKDGHGHPQACKNEFETPFSPERPEIIYCESCYQSEVM